MKRKIGGLLVSVMLVIAVVFSGVTEVNAKEVSIESASFTSIVSSAMNLPQHWEISISGTQINAELTDQEAVDGLETLLAVNDKDNNNVLADWETMSNHSSKLCVDTSALADGEYIFRISKEKELGEGRAWSLANYSLLVKNGVPSFYSPAGKTEKEFYDSFSSVVPSEYDGLPMYAGKMDHLDDIIAFTKKLISSCTTDEQKVKAIHDWLAKNISYDNFSIYNNDTTNAVDPDKVYITKKGVCSGYARLAKIMFAVAEIPCLNITGYANANSLDKTTYSGTNHEWNAVYINNKWQLIDITWDSLNKYYGEGNDSNISGQKPNYTYYGISPELIGGDHCSFDTLEYTEVTGLNPHSLKTSFTVGDKFEFGEGGWIGCKVALGIEYLTPIDKCTITGYDMSKAGTQTVNVKYGIWSMSYKITVAAKSEEKKEATTQKSQTTTQKTQTTTEKKVQTTEKEVTTQKTTQQKTATVKKANTLKIKKTSYKIKRAKLKKKKTFSLGVKKAKGKVTYTLSKNAKKAKIKVTKKGKVTIPKKCKKGTYTIKVKAKGNKSYKAKTIKVKIVIK